jgi:type IV secretory pathway VirB9-like protein
LAEHVKHRTGDKDLERIQRLSQENTERSSPPWVRDGREVGLKSDANDEIEARFDGNDTLTIQHGLRRIPKGYMAHSHRGSSEHSIVIVGKDERTIRLKNNAAGAGNLVCKVWIW